MTNTMPKIVTVTRTFTYDVADWIAEYELELSDGGIGDLDTTNREDVIEWITTEATSTMGWYVSASDPDITITVGE